MLTMFYTLRRWWKYFQGYKAIAITDQSAKKVTTWPENWDMAKPIAKSRKHESLLLPRAANGEVLENLAVKNPRETKESPADKGETGKFYKEGATSAKDSGVEMNSIAQSKFGLMHILKTPIGSPIHKRAGQKIVPTREVKYMFKKGARRHHPRHAR
ncbi:hypothetical protein L1987_27407 [Smallanthus sonchifolius]|uniref:Uncharacterized protein n=1 Tax=Smallanthus sonchifolius TaxID=185202 RepID=A0ACB9ICI4_9ASTR|nr:hypothetical protein L1987_27407 [Smallanthus sonchifolius]